jgi:UDP-GlcNAc:undecaprenyl-phosphate GlcNAc-1-phosphate transferase
MLAAYAIMFCLAFTVAVISAPLVRTLAIRVGAIDRPDGKRKIHAKPMPRLGGLVITVALVAASAAYYLMHRDIVSLVFTTGERIAGFIAGFVIILGLGIYDDISPVRPRVKILFQTIAVAVCYAVGLRIEFPSIAQPQVEAVLSFAATWFWIVACTNSMNLVDGMDGLASGVAFFAGAVIFVVAALHVKFAVALAAAGLLGSVVGFLMYNWHPAVMFLGDSGSLLLGYLIAVLALAGSLKSHAAVALLVPILALGLPIMDTMLAILRRVSRRLPISQADREHVHHRLLGMGLSSREAVLVLYTACLTLAAGALIVASADLLLLLAFAAGLICLGAVMGVEFLGARQLSVFVRRAINRFHHLRSAPEAERTTVIWLACAQSLEDVELALKPWVGIARAFSATVKVVEPVSKVLVFVKSDSVPASPLGTLERALIVGGGRRVVLVLEGAFAPGYEVPAAIRDALAEALERLEKQGIWEARAAFPAAPRYTEGVAAR